MINVLLRIIIICIIGTLLHFTYEESNHNKVVGIFSAVNESVWEHIKIALTPTILLTMILGYKDFVLNSFFPTFLISLLTIIILIPLLFYSYTHFTKKSILVIDVICFYITVTVSQLVYDTLLNLSYSQVINYISFIGILVVLIFYLLLTLLPIKNDLFKDPITKKYGVKGHSHNHNHKHKK